MPLLEYLSIAGSNISCIDLRDNNDLKTVSYSNRQICRSRSSVSHFYNNILLPALGYLADKDTYCT